jgi:hypothetical protein
VESGPIVLSDASQVFTDSCFFFLVFREKVTIINARTLAVDEFYTLDVLAMKHMISGASFSNFGKGMFFSTPLYIYIFMGVFLTHVKKALDSRGLSMTCKRRDMSITCKRSTVTIFCSSLGKYTDWDDFQSILKLSYPGQRDGNLQQWCVLGSSLTRCSRSFADGLADPDDVWRFHRMLTKPFLSRDRVTDFGMLSRNLDKMVSVIPALAGRSVHKGAIDFQVLAGRLTVDTGMRFLSGHELV